MSIFAEQDSVRPSIRQYPLEVAKDTFVIRANHCTAATSTSLNSMLIRGAEPIVVDTGMAIHREAWFEDLFSLIDADELRWIFITHDDLDHTGNLTAALERCPNAKLVVNRNSSWRTSVSFGIPHERIKTVEEGVTFETGGRSLEAIRPPVYDSPYTLGLWDCQTRVYYASDAFCAPMPAEPVDWAHEIPEAMWIEGFAKYHHYSLCPWVGQVDHAKFRAQVRQLQDLGIATIVGAHTPPIAGETLSQAFGQLADLPLHLPGN